MGYDANAAPALSDVTADALEAIDAGLERLGPDTCDGCKGLYHVALLAGVHLALTKVHGFQATADALLDLVADTKTLEDLRAKPREAAGPTGDPPDPVAGNGAKPTLFLHRGPAKA